MLLKEKENSGWGVSRSLFLLMYSIVNKWSGVWVANPGFGREAQTLQDNFLDSYH